MRLKNKQIVAAISMITIAMAGIYIKQNYLVIHNKSVSLPDKWFVVSKGKVPQKGQVFAFTAKENTAYKPDEIFIKIAGGIGGDQISINNRQFYINDQLIGIAKPKSLKGYPLDMLDAGTIPENNFFAYTPHKDSYDSRYNEIGLINAKDIIGTAIFAF
jgi:conjugal transfer pilin signal peptidase TrbI